MNYLNFFKKPKFLDFILIGAQKAGTTAMYHYLKQHPETHLPEIKELHFFDNDNVFINQKINYSEINNNFKGSNKKIKGEVTPSYIYWRPSIERIYNFNPNIKLIAILRNPISRAFSHWNHELKMNTENRTFRTCIDDELYELKLNAKYQDKVKSYISRGMYSDQIDRIRSFFNQDQVLYIKYESFLNEQLKTINEVTTFLNLSKGFNSITEDYKQNYKPYDNSITDDDKSYLLNIFRDDILKVENELNWDCSDWLTN